MSNQIDKIENAEDLQAAEARIKFLQNSSESIRTQLKDLRKKTIQNLLSMFLQNVTIAPERKIAIFIDEQSVTVRYIWNVEKSHSTDMNFRIAKKYDVFEYSEIRNTLATKNNISINSPYAFSFNGSGIDLLNREGERKDFDIVEEHLAISTYLLKEFKYNGLFVQNITESFTEMRVLWDELDNVYSEGRNLNGTISNYNTEQCRAEVLSADYIKEGNVIVVKLKKKEFVHVIAYHILQSKKKTFVHKTTLVEVRCDFGRDDKTKFYLNINYRSSDTRRDKSHINSWLTSHKASGDEILIYTEEEWKDYIDLVRTETENITQSNKLEKHYAERSAYYEKIYKLDR